VAIKIITGLPGSGKTYVLAKIAKQYLEEGRNVYSNFWLDWNEKNLKYWTKLDDLTNIQDGVILMDEAQVYFNSRSWSELDTKFQYKLQQHRKDGLDIWGTVQHEARIDVVMRELISEFYKCHRIIGSKEDTKYPWGMIWVSSFYPEDLKAKTKTSNWNRIVFINKAICAFYNTLKKIEIPEQENIEVVKYSRCIVCGQRKRIV